MGVSEHICTTLSLAAAPWWDCNRLQRKKCQCSTDWLWGLQDPIPFTTKNIAKVWICVPKHEGSATGLPGMAIGAKAQRVGVDFYDMCGLPSL